MLTHAHLDLGLHLLGPSQFLGLGDGCGKELGFKGWRGSIGDLLRLALSSHLLGGDLKEERPPHVRARRGCVLSSERQGLPVGPCCPNSHSTTAPSPQHCLPSAQSCSCPAGVPGLLRPEVPSETGPRFVFILSVCSSLE